MHPVSALSHRLVDELAALLPSHATMWGVPGHDGRWEDLSPEGDAERAGRVAAWRREVAALPPAVDPWDALAVHVLEDHLARMAEELDAGALRTDLRHVASPVQGFALTFDAMDAASEVGWHAIVDRLEGLGPAMAGYRASLASGLARGEAVAARQARSAVHQARTFAASDGAIARIALRARPFDDAAFEARLATALRGAREAYDQLAAWLASDYLPRAPERDGVGPAAHGRALRRFLGASVDPDEAIAWGWSEVRRLRAELLDEAGRVAPGASIAEALAHASASTAVPTVGGLLEAVQARQEDALRRIAPHVDVPEPLRRLAVREAPLGTPSGAWYRAPSEDLARPGAILYARPGEGPFPLRDEVSTAYHEGFPGHHLQIGTQVTVRAHLSRLHRVVYGYAGFAEGWALYAERWMDELGGYELPAYRLGYLVNQLARACRVVFDIGAHTWTPIPADAPFHPGEPWTWERGVELLHEVAGLPRAHAESEVTRYLGWPGQAPSYLLGQRAILEARRTFLARGGDLRAFHRRVLACGNVGLARLHDTIMC